MVEDCPAFGRCTVRLQGLESRPWPVVSTATSRSLESRSWDPEQAHPPGFPLQSLTEGLFRAMLVREEGEESRMKLYLVQHGEAESKKDDPARSLTKRGRDDVARVSAFAGRAGVQVHQIRHSPKNRAAETAAILVEHLEPAGGILALPGLAPKDDVRPVAELLNRETRSLMFVGHRPFMDRLVGLLAAGDEACSVVRFQRGGIVCLERDPKKRTWSIQWVVTPALIP